MLMLFLPLLVVIPFGLIGVFAYDRIGEWLAKENTLIKDYIWLIYICAIAFAYFEVFYAWAKVQMKTVFGNFMREVFHRLGITVLLVCFYFKLITVDELIYSVTGIYILRTLVMKLYAYSLKAPSFRIYKIGNLTNVLKYTTLIIIAGSIANIILEIDKFMIGHYVPIENVAYYGVAIYIAMVINVPYRSLHQIASPITAKLLNEKNKSELSIFYRKSSINLFVISGFIFLLIVLNINEMYKMIPENYSEGLLVVFLISFAKLLDSLLGNNNAILFNSDHYRVVLAQGVFLTIITVALNMLFIPKYSINGAAFASFICMVVYNTVKITYVYRKFGMQPFSVDTVKTLVLILVSMGIFYFWDFPFYPLISIALKSLLITVFYVLLSYHLDLSEDINKLIDKYLLRR